jgi:hypothetical protein
MNGSQSKDITEFLESEVSATPRLTVQEWIHAFPGVQYSAVELDQGIPVIVIRGASISNKSRTQIAKKCDKFPVRFVSEDLDIRPL